jgi:hypothetical protein
MVVVVIREGVDGWLVWTGRLLEAEETPGSGL